MYTLKCCCERFERLVRPQGIFKEGLMNYIKNAVKPMTIATTNAMKKSAIAEHLINHPICEKHYNATLQY